MSAIADFLDATGLSQREFGEAIGVSQGMVSQWIHGSSKLTAERARQIHETWRIPLESLRPDLWPLAESA